MALTYSPPCKTACTAMQDKRNARKLKLKPKNRYFFKILNL